MHFQTQRLETSAQAKNPAQVEILEKPSGWHLKRFGALGAGKWQQTLTNDFQESQTGRGCNEPPKVNSNKPSGFV